MQLSLPAVNQAATLPILLAREEDSDFISPMKLLAAGAVCTVRCCASSALREEQRGEDGGAELAVLRQSCRVHPGSQGTPADRTGMMSRLENAHTGSPDSCLWVVGQNARSCSVS